MPELHPRARHAQTSIFTHMSLLAARHGAVNLGQGFPSNPPPAFLLDAARRAVGTVDQYTPPLGLPALREALGADLNVDPADVIVTSGATEGLLTLALSLLVPTRDGQPAELVVFEPVYDVYVPQAELAGARAVPVPLHLDPEAGWSLDLAAVRAAITPRTQALLVNTPHNPTGLVFSRAELTELVALAREHDLWLISDEVYDELYASERPTSLRELAPERTFTVGSAGKRLEVTGWRVGWILCPPGLGGGLSLAGGLANVRQVTSFCSPAPLQAAVAEALPLARSQGYYAALRADYAARRALLSSGLRSLGAQVHEPQGTYFLTAQHPTWTAESLVESGAVAVIPGEAFYVTSPPPAGLLRFAFCKSPDELEQALERLARLSNF
ncbi:pyridoxal phosphate-dependent aminotransferase [Deinococcus sp. PESE-13]